MAIDDIILGEPEVPADLDLDAEDVALEAEGEEDAPVVYTDEMADNLVPTFAATKRGREFLKDTLSQIVEEVEEALDGSEQYRAENVKILKMFNCDIPKKTSPFEDCANIHVPIVLENILLIASQSWAELFEDWTQVFSVLPMGEADEPIADALTIHGNWQIRKQIPGFRNELSRGLLMFYLFGDVCCHSTYDAACGLNNHQMLTADEFVTPYSRHSSKPDYSDLPWYCRRLWYHKHEMKRMRGVWEDVDAVLEKKGASWDSDHEPVIAVSANTTAGLEEPDSDKRAPYEIYQYEGWLDLPEMDQPRWCQVFVEPKTRIVLQFRIFEEENWQDRARYNQQLQERDDFFVARAERETAMMQQQAHMDMMGQAAAMGDPSMGMGGMPPGTEMMPEVPPEPLPPEWMTPPEDGVTWDSNQEPVAPRMDPIRLFSHGVNVEPVAGNLGIGHGRIQAGFNRPANTLYNQFVDAGTLANTQSLMVSDSVEFERPFTVGVGKVNKVRGVGPNIKDHVVPLSFPGANPQLAEMADRINGYAKGAAQANDVLAGQPGKSGEAAKMHASRLAQATKMIAVPAEKYQFFLEQILVNNAKLNAQYLRDEELYWVANPITKTMDQKKVRREWYDRSYHIEFRADLTFEGKQGRIAQADEAAGLIAQNPITAGDASLQYAALTRQLQARGLTKEVSMLPPPPPKGMPMGMYMQMLAMGPPGMAQGFGMPPPGQPGQAPGGPPADHGQANPNGGQSQPQPMPAGPPPPPPTGNQ